MHGDITGVCLLTASALHAVDLAHHSVFPVLSKL